MKRPNDGYATICISLYNEDLAKLDTMVDKLKARGLNKANRSGLIRYALEQLTDEQLNNITRKDLLSCPPKQIPISFHK